MRHQARQIATARGSSFKNTFIEYKPPQSPIKNKLNLDLKGITPERDDINASKQSFAIMGSVSSRGKLNDSPNKVNKKVIMHVNQFIPFFMQYHLLTLGCLSEFSKDYQ